MIFDTPDTFVFVSAGGTSLDFAFPHCPELTTRKHLIAAIQAHAAGQYPEECCAYVDDGVVIDLYRLMEAARYDIALSRFDQDDPASCQD